MKTSDMMMMLPETELNRFSLIMPRKLTVTFPKNRQHYPRPESKFLQNF